MNTQHTPGEWIAENFEGENKSRVIYTAEKPQGIANVYPSEEGEANARLIAAAPDLLEALDGILKARQGWFCKTQEQFNLMADALNKANAAIQKATK